MAPDGFLWECECGHVEYGKNPPAECGECLSIDSFMKVPDELVAEREEHAILSNKIASGLDEDDEEVFDENFEENPLGKPRISLKSPKGPKGPKLPLTKLKKKKKK